MIQSNVTKNHFLEALTSSHKTIVTTHIANNKSIDSTQQNDDNHIIIVR